MGPHYVNGVEAVGNLFPSGEEVALLHGRYEVLALVFVGCDYVFLGQGSSGHIDILDDGNYGSAIVLYVCKIVLGGIILVQCVGSFLLEEGMVDVYQGVYGALVRWMYYSVEIQDFSGSVKDFRDLVYSGH